LRGSELKMAQNAKGNPPFPLGVGKNPHPPQKRVKNRVKNRVKKGVKK